jgi:hypothetical protein
LKATLHQGIGQTGRTDLLTATCRAVEKAPRTGTRNGVYLGLDLAGPEDLAAALVHVGLGLLTSSPSDPEHGAETGARSHFDESRVGSGSGAEPTAPSPSPEGGGRRSTPVAQLTVWLNRLDSSRSRNEQAVYRLLRRGLVPGAVKRDPSVGRSWYEIVDPEWSARAYLARGRGAA